MKIESIKINKLKPATYNPRQISTKQYNDLKKSLSKFSLVEPIVVNKDMTIVGGHQRYKICKELKHTEIDCVVLDLSKEEERELNIRLNKNTGDFDMDILANEFDIDELTDWGFKHIDLDINIDKITEGNTEDDYIPEVKESRVKLGDVWQLGKHRLMCGDSTKESDVKKLMNGKKAELLFTDPPYGISVVSKKGNIGKGVLAKEGTYREVLGDNKFFDPTFLLSLCENQIIWGANYFHNLLPLKTKWIVWDKDRPEGTTFSDCELAWTSIKGVAVKKYKCTWNGMIREGESEKRIHPTQKPLKICKEILNDYSKKNDKILDLFLGSGSTLIACEKTNRICYGMELDTKYCDVIIERWEQFTGQKAKKCG
jgi:DNA modification methylase